MSDTNDTTIISGTKADLAERNPVIPVGAISVEDDGGVKVGRGKPYADTRYLATSHECDETTHHWHHPFFSHRWLRWLSYGLLFHLALHVFFEFAFHITFHTFGQDWLDGIIPGFEGHDGVEVHFDGDGHDH